MRSKPFHSKTLSILGTLSLIALLGLFSACKSYHLGSPVEIPFKSIYIKPVENNSFAPQAQAIISAMLRENFIRDARVKVVTDATSADAVLDVTLTDYERNATARNPDDTTVADVFDLTLIASVSLIDPSTGNYFFENRSLQTTTNAYTANPFQDDSVINYQLSERQSMEQLSRELARSITNEVLSPW